MPKIKSFVNNAADAATTTEAPAAEAPKKGGKKSESTHINPKTGKIMNADDKKKAEEKAAKEAEKKKRIEERELAAAQKKAEREAKEKERAEKKAQREAAAKAKEENRDADVARRNLIADTLLAECQELKIKSPSLRKLVKEQGESLDVVDGKIVVLDARGANPVSISTYLEGLGEDVVADLRKSEKKRKTGWPKREPKPRIKPEEHGVVKLGAREPSIPIDESKPWAQFAKPQGVLMNIQDAVIAPNMTTVTKGEGENAREEQIMAGLRLTAKGEDLGVIDREAVRELGRMIGFKVDFIDKLSGNPALACQVVNHMIGEYRPQLMMFAGDGERVRDVCPGWRETASHAEVAQKAYDVMAAQYPDVHIKTCSVGNDGHLELILTVDVGNGQITPQAGDYLKGGIRVTHRYGTEVKVGLFAERLICTNGLTACSTTYGWTARGAGSVTAQLAYLETQIIESMGRFQALVDNAKKMAETKVSGDPERAIKERMKQMGVPARHLDAILDAFRQEPGDTEWHMLNAITRFATHALGIGRNLREALMEGSGDWVQQFDVVKARIPRSIANRVGAEILQED
jgi:hypothetical protein